MDRVDRNLGILSSSRIDRVSAKTRELSMSDVRKEIEREDVGMEGIGGHVRREEDCRFCEIVRMRLRAAREVI